VQHSFGATPRALDYPEIAVAANQGRAADEYFRWQNEIAMWSYSAKLVQDANGAYRVTFPDIPEAASIGGDKKQALLNGFGALESAVESYFDEKREIPAPSKPKKGQPVVTLPALVVSKVLLANEMIRQGVRKSELARRLDIHMPQVDRLLDPRHSSKLDAVEAAFNKLGKRLEVSVV